MSGQLAVVGWRGDWRRTVGITIAETGYLLWLDAIRHRGGGDSGSGGDRCWLLATLSRRVGCHGGGW